MERVMELLFLAVALSMDSVAISIANGVKCARIRLFEIAKMAFIYGVAQGVMPVIGFVLGLGFVRYIEAFDHFIIFGILAVLGAKMIADSKNAPDECSLNLSLKVLILGALATSIDALSVGVAFSFDDGFDIILAAWVIGLVCFVLCVLASYFGRFLGDKMGRAALILGGVILIFIGSKVLFEHTLLG